MITGLPEEVLLEVLVRRGKYTIDDEVFEEARRLYDEKIVERHKKQKAKKDKYESI